jgi:3-hydroxyisobutyrate dehydrogenase-like beta-hydroxyacid dehydrogenase
MAIKTIAIMAPGHMGHAIGAHLAKAGLRVITNLEDRSADTHTRAERAGIEDVGSDARLVNEADMLLSILPPANAVAFARRAAEAIAASGTDLLYIDCNAISPATAAEIADILRAVGTACVDASIRGGAPLNDRPQPRIYASGPGADDFQALNAYGLDILAIGDQPGQASGLKICAASVSKGVVLLMVQAFAAARALGVEKELREELQSHSAFKGAERRAPNLGPDAYRWASEMDEIAGTFAATGLSPRTYEGFADLCRLVESTPMGKQTKENMPLGKDLDEISDILVKALEKK